MPTARKPIALRRGWRITLRTATFIPDAGRYIHQQGKAVVGQVQRLGVRLDWARLEAAP